MKIQLSHLGTSSEQLAQFLIRHAETLRELQLIDIELIAGTWAEAIEFMPKSLKLRRYTINGLVFTKPDGSQSDITFSKLDCCYSNSLHTSCFKGRVENYIVKRGNWPECLGKADRSTVLYNAYLEHMTLHPASSLLFKYPVSILFYQVRSSNAIAGG